VEAQQNPNDRSILSTYNESTTNISEIEKGDVMSVVLTAQRNPNDR
jgi:hypothetical protein